MPLGKLEHGQQRAMLIGAASIAAKRRIRSKTIVSLEGTMEKQQILNQLQECGVVAVVRADSEEQAMKIADACIKGGVKGIESPLLYLARQISSKPSPKSTPQRR